MKRSRIKSRPKPSGVNRALAHRFWLAVCPKGVVCVNCRRTHRRMEAHHVIRQQEIIRICAALRLSADWTQVILWDPDMGVPVCDPCHDDHTAGAKRIPRSRLPQRVLIAARALDARFTDGREPAMREIERYYP